jgi:hypothetical protein
MCLGLLTLTVMLAQSTPLPQDEWVASGAGETRTQSVAFSDEQARRTTHTALVVAGAGETSTYWRNTRWRLEPNRAYAFRVRLKGEGSGGCAIVGANVVNRDYIPSRDWQTVGYAFRTPADTREAFIRVGHWQWRGEVMFAQPELIPVEIVHAFYGDFVLGVGERIQGTRYRFISQFEGELSNAQAPLKEFTAVFNTNRWVFGVGAQVVYRHALGNRRMRQVTLSLSVSHEQDGALSVQVRADGGEWQSAATIRGRGSHTVRVPETLLPARVLEVRLVGQEGRIVVDRYELDATLERPVAQPLVGRSLVLYPDKARGDWWVSPIALISNAQGEWMLLVEATNRTRTPARLNGFCEGDEWQISVFLGSQFEPLRPNEPRVLAIPLPSQPTGAAEARIGLLDERSREIVWSARLEYRSHFLEWAHYGYRLKGAPAWAGLWWCEWGWKVGRTRGLPRETREAVRLSAARGEYEPVQIVLRPMEPLRLLRAEPSDLRAGRHRIPARHITLREVAYVPVEYPTDTLGAIDDYPDPLPPLQTPLTLAAGQNQPLWLTVYVPYGTPAGVYTGTLTLRTSRGALTVPLEVTVYDFDLPRVPTLRSGFGISAERIFQYHKPRTDEQKRELWDRYMQAFRRARLSPYTFSLEPYQVRLEDGRVVLDFTAFDRAAKRYLDEFGFNSFVLPVYGLPGGRYPNYSTAEFLGFKEGTPEYERYWTDYMRQLQEHLRQRGWLRKAYIYWFDEPEEADYPFVRRVKEQIKRAAPDLTIMLTEQPEPPLIGVVDLWCPLTAFLPLKSIAERRKAGEEVWWYVCTGPRAPYVGLFIDHPGTEMRVWLWQTWKYSVQGILIWETTWWHNPFAYPDRLQNPWDDPMSYVWDASFKPGTRQFWGNGDGRLLYPPRRDPNASDEPVIADPIPSIRWECLRDGAEDYEYFVLLERLVRQAEGRRVDARLLQQARELLRVPRAVVASMTAFTHDPRVVNEYRTKLARVIEQLQVALATSKAQSR